MIKKFIENFSRKDFKRGAENRFDLKTFNKKQKLFYSL